MSTTGPVMTVTDELLAEIAQELNRCKFSDDDDGDESWPSISGEAVSALTAELRRLRAENAELGGLLREAGKTIHKLQAEQPTPLRIARYLDAMRAKIDAAMATK